MINIRLIDIFFIGPLDLLISKYVENKFLKYFMIYTGVTNILYNGFNYLYLEQNIIDKNYLGILVDKKHGKTQIHRLYNLLIMYPLMIQVYRTTKLPKLLKKYLKINIILGFLYNLYYFILILNN